MHVDNLPRLAKVDALRSSDIGEGLPERTLERLADLSSVLSLETGDILTEEGNEGHHAYVILAGAVEVQICTNDPKNPASNRMLYPGSVIGEMSILESNKRTARTVVSEPSVFLCLHDQDLWAVFDEEPLSGYYFMRNLACLLSRRLRVTNQAIRHSYFMN
ncbi:MAG TPA: Crp/Fnr family transcriptional regulator [Fibrobacteraceae bacterium]|nr:Crp/Fnr family transcriptional regulator [Fibrobacteraceae bacterium]